MAIADTINRIFREFKRYTGDGLPGEPTGAPLPIGDPQSGPYSPKKSELRAAFIEVGAELEEATGSASSDADRAEAAADAAEAALSSVANTSFPTVAAASAYSPEIAPTFLRTEGYASSGDGGGALYKKVASEPTHLGKFSIIQTNATVVWYEIHNFPINPRMFGVVGDGSDETAKVRDAAQRAADLGVPFVTDEIEIWVQAANADAALRGLYLPPGTHWISHPKTIIRALPTSEATYSVLNLINTSDVVIDGNGMRVLGDRDDHTGVGGEHGHCFDLRGSSGITIRDVTAMDGWGDGFYIGRSSANGPCENINLINVISDNNRRQGMSIASVRGLYAKGTFKNTNGTAPQAGIDIEPNVVDDPIVGVVLDVRTEANASAGVVIYLKNLTVASEPVDMTIRHVSVGDYTALNLSSCGDTAGSRARGVIDYYGQSINAVRAGMTVGDWDSQGPTVTLHEPYIYKPNTGNDSGGQSRCGILFWKQTGTTHATKLGGVTVLNPTIIDDRSTSQIDKAVYVQNSVSVGEVEAIKIIDPVKIVGVAATGKNRFEGKGYWSDKFRQSVEHATSSRTISRGSFSGTYDNEGAAGTVNLTLDASFPADCPEIVVERVADHQIRIVPDASSRIYPQGTGNGKYIALDTTGSRVKLRRYSSTRWLVVEQVGTIGAEP